MLQTGYGLPPNCTRQALHLMLKASPSETGEGSEPKVALGQRETWCWFTGEHLPIRLYHIRLRIDLQAWQIGVVHHRYFAQTPATPYRRYTFLQAQLLRYTLRQCRL